MSLLKQAARQVGGLAGDGLVVVAEDGLLGRRERGTRAGPSARAARRGSSSVHGRVHLGLEVVDPELVEVAEDDVARAAGDEAGPVVEGLAVVLLEVRAALLHLDEDDGLPDEVGEGGAAAVFARPCGRGIRAWPPTSRTPAGRRPEEAVEEDLGLALFVAGDVLGDPGGEIGESLASGVIH